MRPALAVCALLAAGGALAQPAPRPPRARVPCAVSYHPLPAALGDLLAPASPLSVTILREGAFVAFRDRDGALRLARTDDDLEPITPVRTLAGDVSAFSMTATREGVALAWVEARRTLVLARVDAENELENVPRVLAASGDIIDRVVVARAGDDLATAWSTDDGARAFALRADARGVPRGGAQGMGEGRVVDLAWQADLRALTLTIARDAADGWSVALDERGRELSRARWPAGARGPVAVDGASWMVSLSATGAPALTRALSPALAAEVPPAGVRLDAVPAREGVAVAVVSDLRAGRATLSRLDLAGSVFLPMVLRDAPAGPEAVALGPAGDAIAVLREARRVAVARMRCAR